MFAVWDINVEALNLFLAVQSQWRVIAVGMAGTIVWLGLDYAGVDVFMRRAGIADAEGALFSDLLVMESAAMGAFAEAAR